MSAGPTLVPLSGWQMAGQGSAWRRPSGRERQRVALQTLDAASAHLTVEIRSSPKVSSCGPSADRAHVDDGDSTFR